MHVAVTISSSVRSLVEVEFVYAESREDSIVSNVLQEDVMGELGDIHVDVKGTVSLDDSRPSELVELCAFVSGVDELIYSELSNETLFRVEVVTGLTVFDEVLLDEELEIN